MKSYLKIFLLISLLLLLNACGNSCYEDITIGKDGAYTNRTLEIQMQAYSPNKDLAYTDTGIDLTDKSNPTDSGDTSKLINLTVTGDTWLCSNKNWMPVKCDPKKQSDTDPYVDTDGNPCLSFVQYLISARISGRTPWIQVDQNIYKDDVLVLSVGAPSFNSTPPLGTNPADPSKYQPQINAWAYNDTFNGGGRCPDTLPLSGNSPGNQSNQCPLLYNNYPDEPNTPYYTCPQKPINPSNEDTAFQKYNGTPINCWMVGGAGLKVGLSLSERCGDADNNNVWFNEAHPVTTTPDPDFGIMLVNPKKWDTRAACGNIPKQCMDPNNKCDKQQITSGVCCDSGSGVWVPTVDADTIASSCTNITTMRSINGISRDYASLCVRLPALDGTHSLGGYQLNILRMSCKASNGQISSAAGKNYYNVPNGQDEMLDTKLGELQYIISPNPPTNDDPWISAPIQDGKFSITPPSLDPGAKQRLYLRIADNDYRDNSGLYTITITYKDYSGTVIVSGAIEWVKNIIRDLTVGPPGKPGAFAAYFKNMSGNHDYAQFIRILLVLYIVIYGIAFTMGSVQISQKDLLIRTIKIGLVFTLLTDQSWEFFNNNFFRLFTDGVNDLIRIATLQDITKNPNTFQFVDDFLTLMFSVPTLLKIFAIMVVSSLGIVLAIMFLISIILFLIGVFKVVVAYLMSILVISLLIMLAPIFIPCILFGPTRSFFENWIKKLVHYSIEPIMLVVGLYLLSQIMYVTFIRIVDFTVCWKCVWPVYFPLLSDLFNIDQPIFCISFFAPFGVSSGGFSLTLLVNILFFLILASLVKGFEELIRGMLPHLLGDASTGTALGGVRDGKHKSHADIMLDKVSSLKIPGKIPEKIPFVNVKIPRSLGGGSAIPFLGGKKLNEIPDVMKKGLKGELYKAFGIDSLFHTHFRKEFERPLKDLSDPTKSEAQQSRAASHIFSEGLLGKHGDDYKKLLKTAAALPDLSPAQAAMLPQDLKDLHSTLSDESKSQRTMTALKTLTEDDTSKVQVYAAASSLAADKAVRTTFADIDKLQRLSDEVKKALKAAPGKDESQAKVEEK